MLYTISLQTTSIVYIHYDIKDKAEDLESLHKITDAFERGGSAPETIQVWVLSNIHCSSKIASLWIKPRNAVHCYWLNYTYFYLATNAYY